jgi:hypothetical protein
MVGTFPSAGGWGADRDAFVTTVAELLAAGPHAGPLTDPAMVLAARDRVLGEVRALVELLSRARPDPGPVTLTELVERPSVALAGALRLLPTPAAYQQTAPSDPLTPNAGPYERLWQTAAHRAAVLEQHVDTLHGLPAAAAGRLLAELADVAAALGPLDADLAAACHATLGPLVTTYLPALTDHVGHAALRLCVTEVRLSAAKETTHSPQPRDGDRYRQRLGPPTNIRPTAQQRTPTRVAVLLSDLGTAMSAVTGTLGERGLALSVPELRAVAALCESGAAHTAAVLRRAAPAVPGAQHVAEALLPLVEAAAGLRRVPVRSLTPPRAEVPVLCGELRRQLSRLAAVATRLPQTAPDADLCRLAAPALAWATQVSPVSDALTTAVHAALDAALLAVPTELRSRRGPALLWAPASSSGEPPRVLAHAHELRQLAEPVGVAARQVVTTLTQVSGHPGGAALHAAAATAGTAHSSLTHALASRSTNLGPVARDPVASRHPGQAAVPRLQAR